MKQHSFKQNYPWLLLLVWLYSCQQQDEIPMIEPIDNGHLIVSAADVPQVVYELQQSLRFKQEGKLFGINDGEQSLHLEIDWGQIYQLIDEQGKETYTFRIADGDGDFATFYNLVMKFSENGDPYTPFLMKYTMSEAYAQAFLETGGGASFEGSVQRILLSKPASTTASTANLEDPFGGSGVDTNPCPGEIPIGGGNTGGTDPSNVGDNCQMMLVTTTWYSQVCDPSGCGAPTVVDITQSLEFVCDSDGATAAWSETECDPVDEEIPILEPDFTPCDTGDEILDNENIQSAMDNLWTESNAEGRMGARLENGGWILQDGNGNISFLSVGDDWQRTACGMTPPQNLLDNLPENLIGYIHTHPFYQGENTSSVCGNYPGSDSYTTGTNAYDLDFLAQVGTAIGNFAIRGYIMDGNNILSYNLLGQFVEYGRCNY